MPWVALMMAQLSAAEQERQMTRAMTPSQRRSYYAKKEASIKAWEAEQSKKAAEAALAAEQEAIANATYRNPDHDLYDPLRVAKERTGMKT